jgi:putative CocE/NonD family hydrolase
MNTTASSDAGGIARPMTRRQRVVDAATTRGFRLPPRRGEYAVESSIPVVARDGARLLTEHFAPQGRALGTVVMRSPYQRVGVMSEMLGGLFASRGYHVVLQSCRGTFGSDGDYIPGVAEIDDGADTLVWLRKQAWYDGRLAAVGGSALSYSMWAMLMDPPEELVAVAAVASFHDPFAVTHGDGAFALQNNYTVASGMAGQQQRGRIGTLGELLRTNRQGPALAALPVADAAERFVGPASAWYRDIAIRDDPADPYWQAQDATRAVDHLQAPVRLIAGWQDVFLVQTLDEYRRLRDRGTPVALTVGPWTHFEMASRGGRRVFSELVHWVDGQAAGYVERPADDPVAYYITGGGGWRSAPDWPPQTQDQILYLAPGGSLTPTAPTPTAPPVVFTYDPSDPTPTIGGRILSVRAGYQLDSDLARRPDTVALVSTPLREPLEMIGVPEVTLTHRCDNPHFDLWVRISEVRPDGRSRNVTETFRGEPHAGVDGRIWLAMDPAAHRFAAGSRIGLLIGGGSFPRYARNLGTPGSRTEGTELAVSRHVIALAAGASTLSLPVSQLS